MSKLYVAICEKVALTIEEAGLLMRGAEIWEKI